MGLLQIMGKLRKFRKVLSFFAIACAMAAMNSSTAMAVDSKPSDDLSQLSWKTPISVDYASDQPFTKLWVTQGFQGGMPIANLPSLTSQKGNFPNITEGKLCDELDDNCLPDSSWAARGYGHFQLCSVSEVAPCIRGLKYRDAQGVWSEAVLSHEADLTAIAAKSRAWLSNNSYGEPGTKVEAFQTKWGWNANKSIGLPGSGKGPLVFKFPGRLNAAGVDTYALDANFSIQASKTSGGDIKVGVTDFNFQISPVKELACDNPSVSVTVLIKKPSGRIEFGQTGGSCIHPALFTTANSSGFATKFADNFPIKLDLELPKAISGWFQGRLDNPDVTVTTLDAQTSSVEITGEPITVPATNKALELKAEANQALLGNPDFDYARDTAKYGYVGLTGGMWAPDQGVDAFNKWEPYLEKRARGSVSLWTISHFKSSSRCMNASDGLQGLVTTNAMVYQPNVPSFEGGFLKYKVAGVHLDQNGSTVLGTYNFIMKSEVARCLYGFSKAPISGTISITSSNAQENIAVTSVTEKAGWLKLSALGFTFSSPTISAKLTQASVVPKIKTIVCVKKNNSKLAKKISGISPKCPSGFRQK
jgi:hypothetical protein